MPQQKGDSFFKVSIEEKEMQCRHFVSKILRKSMEMMEYVELKHKI